MDLNELKREIPHKWRIQQYSKFKAEMNCVAYINSRDVQDLLDEVVGPQNWQCRFESVKNNMFCSIGIKVDNEWVWKSDCGTESKMDKEKGEASDAFKRAAVKWGIGRFLYSKKIVNLQTNVMKTKDNYPYPIDKNGKRIWNITEYIVNNKVSEVEFANTVDKKLFTRVKDALGKLKTPQEINFKVNEITDKMNWDIETTPQWFSILVKSTVFDCEMSLRKD